MLLSYMWINVRKLDYWNNSCVVVLTKPYGLSNPITSEHSQYMIIKQNQQALLELITQAKKYVVEKYL